MLNYCLQLFTSVHLFHYSASFTHCFSFVIHLYHDFTASNNSSCIILHLLQSELSWSSIPVQCVANTSAMLKPKNVSFGTLVGLATISLPHFSSLVLANSFELHSPLWFFGLLHFTASSQLSVLENSNH